MLKFTAQEVTGVILAGGRARRMQDRDKGLLPLGDKPLVAHVIERLRPQVPRLCINANRNLARYRRYGYPVFTDQWPDYSGPLAGFYSAMQACPGEWFCIVPCDTPYLPRDLVDRLVQLANQQQVPVVSVREGERLHATICLLHRDRQPALLEYYRQGHHRVQEWIRSQPHALLDCSDNPGAFININQPQQLETGAS